MSQKFDSIGALHLKASTTPVEVIEHLARRPDQPPALRQYQPGFEPFFNQLPVLIPGDPLLKMKTSIAGDVMRGLAQALLADYPSDTEQHSVWTRGAPEAGQFKRLILAVEDPQLEELDESLAPIFAGIQSSGTGIAAIQEAMDKRKVLKEGAEVLIGQWGEGFSSQVHGHGAGLLHEEMLFGSFRVNSYRWVREGTVRPVRTDIFTEPGTIVSTYSPPDPRGPRMGYVHNFTAVKPSATLHFLPEHPRDGRDNGFQVEEFPITSMDVIPTDTDGVLSANTRIGDVFLVRSANVPEYADHYIVIVGPNKMKAHGLRPDDVAIHTEPLWGGNVLDQFTSRRGVTILKLQPETKQCFLEFHDIKVEGNSVQFPNP